MNRVVIIPSAKRAPKDLSINFEIPMVLFPFNGKPILSYIEEKYANTRLVVSGYEMVERISEFVSLTGNKRTSVYELKELRDLGYTIYETLKNACGYYDNLIINLADTIVDNCNITGDTILFSRQFGLNSKWTYLIEENGVITGYIDRKKTEINIETENKIFVGVFSISHKDEFLAILGNAIKHNSATSLFETLAVYSKQHAFSFIEANNWLDIGHPDEYFKSKVAVKEREFNHLEIDINRGIIKKTSTDFAKFQKEIEWYIKLPRGLKYISPRIFDYSPSEPLFVEMEYYSYNTLLELFLFGDLKAEDWVKIFNKIRFILEDFKKYTFKDNELNESIFDMYYLKTKYRLEKLRQNDLFKPFFDNTIYVNGVAYLPLNDILPLIERYVNDELMDVKEFCVIHGDMCFPNMLIDDKLNFIKLIDPRGEFGKYGIYGDQRYEIAKLLHSIDGKYDYIIKDLFRLSVNKNSIDYSIDNNYPFDLYELFKQQMIDYCENLNKIEFIESLLFLSMIPLHAENVNHQYVMLATGLEILSRIIDIKEC